MLYERKHSHKNGSYEYNDNMENESKDGQKKFISPISRNLQIGTRVEADYLGMGDWHPGRIDNINQDGTFNIAFDDGDEEMFVPRDRIKKRRVATKDRMCYKPGTRVDADYRGEGEYYPGYVAMDNMDGTVDVKYDDGDFESHVPKHRLKTPGQEESEKSCSGIFETLFNFTSCDATSYSPKRKITIGCEVEVNYLGSGTFYKGVVVTINGSDETFDVEYEDGEIETHVALKRITLLRS